MKMPKVRLGYLVSHPIQYQAPLLREIAKVHDIELTVFFRSDISIKEYQDHEFGVKVLWDIDLLSGYRHIFLPKLFCTKRVVLHYIFRTLETSTFMRPPELNTFLRLTP
jgi:hypothetical protein